MVALPNRLNKRHGIGGAIVGVIVVVVIIIAAVAGYYAAAASIKGGGTTTVTVTGSAGTGGASTVTSTVTVTPSLSAVTSTITGPGGNQSTVVSYSTITSTGTVTSTATSTSIQTTLPPPTIPSSLPSATISETGSSLLYPLLNLWVSNFTKVYSNVQINTGSTGSGTGQSQVENGQVQLGASDPFLSNTAQAQYPNILDIAVAVSAQQINFNLPGIKSLNLTGNVLAGIYNGTITTWNSAAIQKLNPGVSLPSNTIIPIVRQDSSGDTNLFTTFLSDTSPDWAKSVGAGNTVSWPTNPSEQQGNGNAGMLQKCMGNPYSIAYIGISYLAQANSASLGHAWLQNAAGNFVDITPTNIQAAVNAQFANTPPSERLSLIYGPGANSYPIVNYEYLLVSNSQSSPALATDIKAFLDWATLPTGGNAPYFLNQVGFVPLPSAVASLSWAQIAQIGSGGTSSSSGASSSSAASSSSSSATTSSSSSSSSS